eukprot:TRINITY_DN61383_c2_g2_i1.p1 TRINITY_DN61383_c2_g2~~TRINITY_DN61383_c2_g2_i1.p1  ORF type:complete len:203 (-),score=23.71 TRINITY_DN61383_c2_g2_i1:46-654(-)
MVMNYVQYSVRGQSQRWAASQRDTNAKHTKDNNAEISMIKRVCITGALVFLLQACGGSGESGETFQAGPPQSFIPDSDGDGFTNDIDACLNTAEGATVSGSGSRQGCSDDQIPDQEDEDADTVVNIDDQCLGTDAGLTVNEVGCAPNQLDTDNDTISDALDVCPGTEDGATDVITDINSEAVGCTPEQAEKEKKKTRSKSTV